MSEVTLIYKPNGRKHKYLKDRKYNTKVWGFKGTETDTVYDTYEEAQADKKPVKKTTRKPAKSKAAFEIIPD